MTADHILRNTATTLTITFTAGEADGDVTYTVTDAAGTEIDSGTATHGSGGTYSFVLQPQDTVKSLTIVWAGAWSSIDQSLTTYAEIVGGYLFTILEARAFDNSALTNETTYTDDAIREARAGIADFFEHVTGVSFIPRYGAETVDGTGSRDLWLRRRKEIRSILSASVSDTVLTTDELGEVRVYPYGKLYRPSTWWSGWGASHLGVTVAYEHGFEAVPWEIHRAALIYLRYILVSSDISDRTISMTNDFNQTVRFSLASLNYPTGIPTVDAALNRYRPTLVLA